MLRAAVDALDQGRQQGNLRDKVTQLHQNFRARENFQTNARNIQGMIAWGEQGYSTSKQHTEEKRRVVYSSSGAQSFEKVLQTAEEEMVYDTDADNEADQLSIAIKREKNDQKHRKNDHRKQMEKREKCTVISWRERREALDKATAYLMSSERVTWVEGIEKLD